MDVPVGHRDGTNAGALDSGIAGLLASGDAPSGDAQPGEHHRHGTARTASGPGDGDRQFAARPDTQRATRRPGGQPDVLSVALRERAKIL